MLSMPPAAITSASSSRIACAASATAMRPEPHTLFTVSAACDVGSPAPRPAWRAGACPSPALTTLPMITCSIASGATPARATAARIACAPSFGAVSDESEP